MNYPNMHEGLNLSLMSNDELLTHAEFFLDTLPSASYEAGLVRELSLRLGDLHYMVQETLDGREGRTTTS